MGAGFQKIMRAGGPGAGFRPLFLGHLNRDKCRPFRSDKMRRRNHLLEEVVVLRLQLSGVDALEKFGLVHRAQFEGPSLCCLLNACDALTNEPLSVARQRAR